MPGVRIRHHTRRSELLPVPLLHKPFPPGDVARMDDCGACMRRLGFVTKHPCKTLHLELDGNGAVIVSRAIWADLRKVPNHAGFRLESVVHDPPAQTWTPETVKLPIQGVDLGGDLAHVNGRAQYHTHGSFRTNPDHQPDIRTVTLDEYVDVAAKVGVDPATALNVLLAKILEQGR